MNHRPVFIDGTHADVVRILEEETDAVQDGSEPYEVHEVIGGGGGAR